MLARHLAFLCDTQFIMYIYRLGGIKMTDKQKYEGLYLLSIIFFAISLLMMTNYGNPDTEAYLLLGIGALFFILGQKNKRKHKSGYK